MPRDRMQKQRFELKYIISEETALLVRDFVRSYLDFDEHCLGKENFSYPIYSLYLDSDDWVLYNETVEGNKNSYKLRLRSYDVAPAAPVYMEIKRRVNNCILKQRTCIRHERVEPLIKGDLIADPEHLDPSQPTQPGLVALQNFLHLAQQIQAKPKIYVRYLREAYMSDDNQARITLDRMVYADVHTDYSIATGMRIPRPLFTGLVILELKFLSRFPECFRELVRVFGITGGHIRKYHDAVASIDR